MKKSLIIFLTVALLLPCFMIGCKSKKEEETTPTITTPTTTTPEATTPETTTPEVTTSEATTPPDDNDDVVTPPETAMTLTEVSIATGESASEVYAGEELAKYLQQKKIAVKEGTFPIAISIDTTLGDDAFLIEAVTTGENIGMTIKGGNGRGVLYGVYKFLEELGGVRYFMPNLEKVPESPIVITEGVVLEYTPFFEARRLNWNCVTTAVDWCTKQGINGHDGELDDKYGGKQRYGSGLFVHTLGTLSETGGGASPNPCLTSEEIYQTVLKNLRERLAADPTVDIVSVSQNDKNEYCLCDNCKASYAYYTNFTGSASDAKSCAENGGAAGNMLAFVNRIAEELEDEYPNLVIDTLAYNYTQAPPKNIVPRHNVCVRVCSIRVCFMHPMTECPDSKGPNNIQWTRTAQFRKDFLAWGEICDRIYVWDYTTNFTYYIAPFSNFGTIRENMRLYHEHGVRGMFPQGNSQSISGEFGELRAYLLAKLMWNPYMSEEEYYTHMNEFLEAYYGAGWVYIRSYINVITELANDGCINIYEEPLEAITEGEYRIHENDFQTWWNKAEELAGDRLEYVQRSRLQWRYIQLLIHPDQAACDAFTAEVLAYGIRWAEGSNNNLPIDQKFPALYPKT